MKAKTVLSISCFVILFSVIVTQVQAAEWVKHASDIFGDEYYDKSSVRKINNNMFRVWIKVIYKDYGKMKIYSFLKNMDKAPQSPDILSHHLTLRQYDCTNDKSRLVSMNIYDSKGSLVDSSPGGDYDWTDIVPDSVDEALKNIVCKGAR